MRRSLLIVAIAIVVLGLGAGVYFYFSSGAPGVAVAPPGSAALPSAGEATTTPAPLGALPGGVAATIAPRLVEISAGPVVPGEAVVDIAAASASSSPDTVVRYLERASGNVFSYSKESGRIERTSNRTIPGIERARFTPDGATAFVQYLSGSDFSTINTYALAADGSGGSFLPQDLADLAVSSSSVLALASGVSGSSATLYRLDGSHGALAFTSPLSMLRIAFAGKGAYLAFTKPSATLDGYAYAVAGGRFTRVAGPLPGLVALPSQSGKWALVSSALGGALHLALVNIATGETTALPVATIADKCVWAPDDSAAYCGVPVDPPAGYAYPDDWYQGAAHFSDRIWKISVSGRYAELVLDFSQEAKKPLDAEALAIDPAKRLLSFVNKNDGALWAFSL